MRRLWYTIPMNTGALGWVAGEATPDRVYITRVFNFGTLEEWRQMRRRFSEDRIRQVLLHSPRGQWTKRAKRFAEVLFEVRMPEEALISYDA